MMRSRFLTVEVGDYRKAKGGGYNDPCGNGLEWEISAYTHI